MKIDNFEYNDDEKVFNEINVTPLVDVMLVLLIVFIVTMPILTSTIKIDLPTSAVKITEPMVKPLQLTVTQDGMFYLDRQTYSLEELSTKLQQLNADATDKLVLAISSDKNASYEYIAQILVLAKEIGISKVGFVTEFKLESANTN